MTIVYKVLRYKKHCGLFSAVVNRKPKVKYKEGVWSESPEHLSKIGYHLFAFKALADARAFTFANRPFSKGEIFRIYECKAEGITDKLPPQLFILALECGIIKHFDNGIWPDGTIMVKRLMTVKEVDDNSI